uniref:Zinc finger, CCHC-type n=1 Tax=Tanacetum cinerariifolium TaxID=118510 RepID=A0A6L2JZA4_TANCI|nr:hypothetical protein [Tanacetum cinerariifolium]
MVGESSSKSKMNYKNKGKNGGSGQKHNKDGKKDYTQQKNNNFKKVYHCWVCGKPRHKPKDFFHKKEYGGKNSGGNSNLANHLDTGATKYICNSKRMFVSYQMVNESEPMFMGNETGLKIEGKGKVILKLTSRKDLVLSNVLHVPNITKNMISVPILSNDGFKLVFESNKFVITKGEFFENIFPYKDKEIQISNPRKRVIDNQLSQDQTDNNYVVPQENVKLKRRHKPIGHKWIFKKKLRPDGTIEKYKACLVAKIYLQKEGQDFFDTYSPVTRITSIRTLIALAAIHNLIIHQMDLKTAFLNGKLDEEIYIQQPKGFIVKGQEHKVCKLVKSLYGLKQAPKQWHEKFDNTLLSNGFQINACDKCVYVKQYKNAFVIICLYVDDILIMGTNMDVINQTKKMLHSSFDMKDMGEADVILGIRIQNNLNGYILIQSHYIEKTLKKFGHYDDRPVVTPFDSKCKSTQSIHNHGRDHWDALVRVLQYLKHTIAYGLHYTKYPQVLEGYYDANWISNHNEGKSTSMTSINFETSQAGNTQCYSYKTFRSCGAKEFFDTEGVVGLLSWLEGMESVLHISKSGRAAAMALLWEGLKKLLMKEYCQDDAVQKSKEEFWKCTIIRTDADKYIARFHELARLVSHMVNPESKRIDRYIRGLAPAIKETSP